MPAPRLPQDLPSVDYLRACFAYDPETGVLTWKERPSEHFKNDGAHRRFTSSRAGRPAGSLNRTGYLGVGLDATTHQAHRIAWAIYYGAWPEQQLDHINLIRIDNRIANLRDVSQATNRLRQVRRSNNLSGHTGVFLNSKSGKWRAYIRVNGKGHHLGMFADISDAVAARKAASLRFGFSENHGRVDPNKALDAGPGRLRKNNSSGFRGVSLRKRSGRWEVQIIIKGRQIYLGSFKTKDAAIAARKAAEIQYGVADRVSYGSGPAILQDPPT